MDRMLLVLVSAVLLWANGAVTAEEPQQQEPPVRLQKKDRPARENANKPPVADDKKPGLPKDDPDPEPAEPAQDEQETLGRVARNMRTSEERLANKELGDGTRQVQSDIVKGLDALIERAKQQQPSSSSSSNASSESSSAQSRSDQQAQLRNATRNQSAQSQKPGQSDPSKPTTAKRGSGSKPQAGSGGSEEEMNRLADVNKDIWGHLPETERAKMNAYAREHFMSKYSELIKQYYSTLAEETRRQR